MLFCTDCSLAFSFPFGPLRFLRTIFAPILVQDVSETLSADFGQVLSLDTPRTGVGNPMSPTEVATYSWQQSNSPNYRAPSDENDYLMTGTSALLTTKSSAKLASSTQMPSVPGVRNLGASMFKTSSSRIPKFEGSNDSIFTSRKGFSFSQSKVFKTNSSMDVGLYNLNVPGVQSPFMGRSIAENGGGLGAGDWNSSSLLQPEIDLQSKFGFSTSIGMMPTPLHGTSFVGDVEDEEDVGVGSLDPLQDRARRDFGFD